MIKGLHTCKAGNTPTVGQVKCFAVVPTTAQSGNVYNKIKSAKPEEGQHYMVMSVAKTDYSDQHGNVSFNLELEPAAVLAPQQNAPQSSGNPLISTPNLPGVSTPQDSVKQHLMRSANLYALCVEAVDTVIRDRMHRRNIDLHENMAFFQAAVSTLFINAAGKGYIAHMSDREEKPKQEQVQQAKAEPF